MRTMLILTATALSILLTPPSFAAPDFEKEIWPIFKDRCLDCHKAAYVDPNTNRVRKPKAGRRLDGRMFIMAPRPDWYIPDFWEELPVIYPGSPDKSALYMLINEPHDSDYVMPARGEPLSGAQIELIKDWIEAGANFGSWVGATE